MSPALAGRLFTTIATCEVPFADYKQIIPVAQMTITITRMNRKFMKLPTAQTSMLLTQQFSFGPVKKIYKKKHKKQITPKNQGGKNLT